MMRAVDCRDGKSFPSQTRLLDRRHQKERNDLEGIKD